MSKKYKLTEETKVYNGKTLYRIKALKNFSYVNKGQKGGFVESEYNLSQENDCWIDDDAMVFDDARVEGYALVVNHAIVCGCSKVANNALVNDHAFVKDSYIIDNAIVGDSAKLTRGVSVGGRSNIGGNMEITNAITVQNGSYLRGNSKIHHQDDFITFQMWWIGNETITYIFEEAKWFTTTFAYSTSDLIKDNKADEAYIKTLIEMMKLASNTSLIMNIECFIGLIYVNGLEKTTLSDHKVSFICNKSNFQIDVEFNDEHRYKSSDIKILETALKNVRNTRNVQSLYNIPFIKSVEMKLWK